jgi:hypothetical protein
MVNPVKEAFALDANFARPHSQNDGFLRKSRESKSGLKESPLPAAIFAIIL